MMPVQFFMRKSFFAIHVNYFILYGDHKITVLRFFKGQNLEPNLKTGSLVNIFVYVHLEVYIC